MRSYWKGPVPPTFPTNLSGRNCFNWFSSDFWKFFEPKRFRGFRKNGSANLWADFVEILNEFRCHNENLRDDGAGDPAPGSTVSSDPVPFGNFPPAGFEFGCCHARRRVFSIWSCVEVPKVQTAESTAEISAEGKIVLDSKLTLVPLCLNKE